MKNDCFFQIKPLKIEERPLKIEEKSAKIEEKLPKITLKIFVNYFLSCGNLFIGIQNYIFNNNFLNC